MSYSGCFCDNATLGRLELGKEQKLMFSKQFLTMSGKSRLLCVFWQLLRKKTKTISKSITAYHVLGSLKIRSNKNNVSRTAAVMGVIVLLNL